MYFMYLDPEKICSFTYVYVFVKKVLIVCKEFKETKAGRLLWMLLTSIGIESHIEDRYRMKI